ncbi:2-oxo acid dehydrogenase subunit E2 [Nonomuraea salmonea]|uniref:2-oxo acid dehydrogenase subunit E2 n=1 Tax=Nonomuraea salmonea TaxID=46181 RepID=UPI002FEBE0B7
MILRRDVEQAIERAGAASPATPRPLERIPLRGVRRAVAEKMSRSRTEIPDATTWVDVDATDLVAARDALRRTRPPSSASACWPCSPASAWTACAASPS